MTFKAWSMMLLLSGLPPAYAQTDGATPAERTAEAGADKAEWDAKKAELDYRNAANPASGLTGKVDVKANAGNIEANILATKALEAAVDHILGEVAKETNHVVVLPGTTGVDLARWDLFAFRRERLLSNFATLSQDLESALQVLPPGMLAAQPEAAPLGLLSLASKALSYGLSDYEIGGVATTSVTDETIATALAARAYAHGVTVSRPNLLPPAGGPAAVFDMIEGLERQALASKRERNRAKAAADALLKKAGAAGDAATALKEQAAVFTALVARYDATLTATDTLMAALADTSEKNPLPLSAVVHEKVLFDALERAKFALLVNSPASGGGYYTKKNLWTMLGGMPFYVAGGTIVNFTLIVRSTGDIKRAGVVSVLCGYRRVTKDAALNCEHEVTAKPTAKE